MEQNLQLDIQVKELKDIDVLFAEGHILTSVRKNPKKLFVNINMVNIHKLLGMQWVKEYTIMEPKDILEGSIFGFKNQDIIITNFHPAEWQENMAEAFFNNLKVYFQSYGDGNKLVLFGTSLPDAKFLTGNGVLSNAVFDRQRSFIGFGYDLQGQFRLLKYSLEANYDISAKTNPYSWRVEVVEYTG